MNAMSKSVYSVVLSDEIVAAIDQLAWREGISRSGMIDRILAQHVSYETPEMQMKKLFDAMERLVSGSFLPMPTASPDSYQMRTALRYKYSPSLRFAVELVNEREALIKVSLRSRSDTLPMLLTDFFRLWQRLEEGYVSPAPVYESGEPGRWVRRFPMDRAYGPQAQGEQIGRYVNTLRTGLNTYFLSLDEPAVIPARLSEVLDEYYIKGN